jgi:hypothetical protein
MIDQGGFEPAIREKQRVLQLREAISIAGHDRPRLCRGANGPQAGGEPDTSRSGNKPDKTATPVREAL